MDGLLCSTFLDQKKKRKGNRRGIIARVRSAPHSPGWRVLPKVFLTLLNE